MNDSGRSTIGALLLAGMAGTLLYLGLRAIFATKNIELPPRP